MDGVTQRLARIATNARASLRIAVGRAVAPSR
jgi:hypothetical protein